MAAFKETLITLLQIVVNIQPHIGWYIWKHNYFVDFRKTKIWSQHGLVRPSCFSTRLMLCFPMVLHQPHQSLDTSPVPAFTNKMHNSMIGRPTSFTSVSDGYTVNRYIYIELYFTCGEQRNMHHISVTGYMHAMSLTAVHPGLASVHLICTDTCIYYI